MAQNPIFAPGTVPTREEPTRKTPGTFEPSPAVQKIVTTVGEWGEMENVSLKLKGDSKLPGLLYESRRTTLPSLAVLSTNRSVCGEETPACLTLDKKYLIIGQAEFDGLVEDKIFNPKKKLLSPEERERLQLAVVRSQITLAETGGDLYRAYETLLTTVRDKAPKPAEVLDVIFRSRPFDDYLFAAICYGKHADPRQASEFVHGGKTFKSFVTNLFKESRNRLSRLDMPEREKVELFYQYKARRDSQLNPESPLSLGAYDKARKQFAALDTK